MSQYKTDEVAQLNYRRVFRDLPEAYLLMDATTPEFRIVEISKIREQLSEVSRSEVVGRPLFEAFPDISQRYRETGVSELRGYVEQVARSGKPKQLDAFRYDQKLRDGTVAVRYWQIQYRPILDDDKKVRYILSTVREVTDEVRAARRAASAEDRLQAALDIGKVGSWVWDLETNVITGDKNLVKLLRVDKKKDGNCFTVEQLLAAAHPNDKARVYEAIERSITQHAPFDEEYRLVLADGTQRWMLARGKVEEQDGRMIFAGVVVDVTERRDLQAQVALAQEQERLNRQAARILQKRNEELVAIGRSKDEFVALASHQLRTPATAVKQYLGMVLQGYAGGITDIQAEMLQKAFESNERQIQIINQILNAARADTGRLVMAPIPLDLRTLVQSVWNDMVPVFDQHQHKYSLRMPKRPVHVMADQSYLRMAIENILYNACVYTPDGGTITMHLSKGSKNCVLSITDTGVGIRKADYGKLFAKFSRIHNPLSVQAGGSGIGLYLTAEIVRLHNGTISVDSKIHQGATFAISLPLVHNEEEYQAGT